MGKTVELWSVKSAVQLTTGQKKFSVVVRKKGAVTEHTFSFVTTIRKPDIGETITVEKDDSGYTTIIKDSRGKMLWKPQK